MQAPCSLDDTMTDLMCHPYCFDEWTAMLERECKAVPQLPKVSEDLPGTSTAELPGNFGPHAGAQPTQKAGHSGMMQLAASVVKDLARHRLLFKLLCHDDGDASDSPQCSPSRYAVGIF
jgi:hypothetical protein